MMYKEEPISGNNLWDIRLEFLCEQEYDVACRMGKSIGNNDL